jgi:hypothetical protein
MNFDRALIYLFIGGIGTFLVAVVVFYLWAFVYFGGRAIRGVTRSHLYVPVMARVVKVLYSFRPGATTIYVKYEFGGVEIENRFLTTQQVGRLAEHLKQIALRVDPDHPKDVVVDPAFQEQAAAAKNLPVKEVTLSGLLWLSLWVTTIGLLMGFVLGLVLWMNQLLISSEFHLLILSLSVAVLLLIALWVPYCFRSMVSQKPSPKETAASTESLPHG